MASIAIIGTGAVGSSAAFALSHLPQVKRITLIDARADKAEGEALDLRDCSPVLTDVAFVSGESYSLVAGADIIVFTAGTPRQPGQSRLELAATNAALARKIIPELAGHNSSAILLIVSNPVDVLTRVAQDYFPNAIGSGTLLDSMRLEQRIASRTGLDCAQVHAFILGEHGDSSFGYWSDARIGGKRAVDVLSESERAELVSAAKTAGAEIIKRKGVTNFGIAASIARIVQAILTDEEAELPLSVNVKGYCGAPDVCVSVVCTVGKNGATPVLSPLSSGESASFLASATAVKAVMESLLGNQ